MRLIDINLLLLIGHLSNKLHVAIIYLPYSGQKYSTIVVIEGLLECHTYCDAGHPFIMATSENKWHSHPLQTVWRYSCQECMLWFSIAAGFRTPNIPHAMRTSNWLRHNGVPSHCHLFDIWRCVFMLYKGDIVSIIMLFIINYFALTVHVIEILMNDQGLSGFIYTCMHFVR